MRLNKFIAGNLLKIRVVPNSSRTELTEENSGLKLHLKAAPEKNKANKEVIRFFKKEFGLRVEIKFGEKNRDKILEIKDKV